MGQYLDTEHNFVCYHYIKIFGAEVELKISGGSDWDHCIFTGGPWQPARHRLPPTFLPF